MVYFESYSYRCNIFMDFKLLKNFLSDFCNKVSLYYIVD